VQSKHSPERLATKRNKGKEKTWRLAPAERNKVHANKDGIKKKNARNNPRRKK
jgi:hypothetical protein